MDGQKALNRMLLWGGFGGMLIATLVVSVVNKFTKKA